jgi:thioredoxin-related protein
MNIVVVMTIVLAILGSACTAGDSSEHKKESNTSDVNWVSYDEGLKLAAESGKVIFVDFYTNWCKFCKKMDIETFSKPEIAEVFEKRFINVKVNAESNKKITLPDGNLSGRELARSFGVRGYPTYWFLKSDGEKINYYSGFAPPEKFIHILKFVGEGHYENKSFQDYLKEATASK